MVLPFSWCFAVYCDFTEVSRWRLVVVFNVFSRCTGVINIFIIVIIVSSVNALQLESAALLGLSGSSNIKHECKAQRKMEKDYMQEMETLAFGFSTLKIHL